MSPEADGAPACKDAGRAMFYDRVGRFFYDDSDLVDFPQPVPCIICGEPLDRGVMTDGKAACAAQRAITAKRPGVKDALPKPGDPARRYSAAFNSPKKAVFITPDRCFVISAVRPIHEVPGDMTLRTEGTSEVYGELYNLIYGEPVQVPALFVEFANSGAFEFAVTESPDMLQLCGGATVDTIDAGRVREIVAAGRAVGLDGLRRFNQLRGRSLRADLLTDAERDEFFALRDRIAEAGVDASSPPTPNEPAYRIALTIIRGADAS